MDLNGYIDIASEMSKNHDIEELYMIQLFDYNCPSCVSGVTKVFVEDIDEFSRIYQSLEEDKKRIERFLRSKAGEIVTDYYSDSPSLNIVQKVKVEDLGYSIKCKQDAIISIANGYGWSADYYWGVLILEIRWIKYKNTYYKLVKPRGMDCARKHDRDGKDLWIKIAVYGNPFWICHEKGNIPYSANNVCAFKGTSIESYVWHIAQAYDSIEEIIEDRKVLWEKVLSEEQISSVFADIPGDAG